ncbi:hypothetical protein [Thermoproteus tenax]|uniref:Uncharacterized protein n=1 Tax=Thermoproteus tenax (strain ATCC 35583 / DSM 2078 / JCM 9277 / NBRC 100435 / Kra 1) TaxID=768679 RepID=G4RMG0_THETK|nr:hypothetical protein [Thermoproteus tenax]CCC80791.1 hypothetical protein TTX_0115 [Thermoproteus tenax Kra 1]
MSTEEYSWHTIAVGNSILGVYNFIVLAAPPDWKLIIMPMASDIFSYVSKDGAKWVRDGEVKHFIKGGREFFELEIKVKPGNKARAAGSAVEFGGHSGVYSVAEEGLIKRKKALIIEAYCPETDRTITIKIKGERAPLEVLKYVKFSRCH